MHINNAAHGKLCRVHLRPIGLKDLCCAPYPVQCFHAAMNTAHSYRLLYAVCNTQAAVQQHFRVTWSRSMRRWKWPLRCREPGKRFRKTETSLKEFMLEKTCRWKHKRETSSTNAVTCHAGMPDGLVCSCFYTDASKLRSESPWHGGSWIQGHKGNTQCHLLIVLWMEHTGTIRLTVATHHRLAWLTLSTAPIWQQTKEKVWEISHRVMLSYARIQSKTIHMTKYVECKSCVVCNIPLTCGKVYIGQTRCR